MCGQALALFNKMGDEYGEAATWDSLGEAHLRRGDHAQAITCYQRTIEVCREMGDHYHEAIGLDHLGDAHHAAGDRKAAQGAWRQALATLGELPHPALDQIRAKLA
jgi:tetratricopeptide (TPR) repeat protein